MYYYQTPTDSPALRCYGRPKIHKPGVLIRPIVSHGGSTLYNISKYIGNILKAYIREENNHAKNCTRFSNYITNVPIEDDKIIV